MIPDRITSPFPTPAIMQGGWDAFVAAGQHAMNTIFAFTCELAMVGLVFLLAIGLLLYFTGVNSHGGKNMAIYAVVGMVFFSCLYMAILGASGPPDISLWFKPPT
ncbi:MAG: hypothetical protein GYA24_15575 [Candidatus Lokiarchaeota archaeon]|nr:hypothetical protein [Candidatus Lokiarchaeota archaeon]